MRALAASYASRVGAFYDWYRSALGASAPAALVDYRRVLKACMANASRTTYRLFLQRFVENGINPYDHLHKYLLPNQIEEAIKLPKRSKEQVDFIIACLDEYGACDDELRALTYRLFNVPE